MSPWTLKEFDSIMKNANLNENKILQREFPPEKADWYNFFRKLFGKRNHEKISLYEVVGLNVGILLQTYELMSNEIRMMVENLLSLNFEVKWQQAGESLLSGEGIYRVSDNNHLILCEPNDDYQSYTSLFGTPLLITCFSKMVSKMKTEEIFNFYERGMVDGSFPRASIGILYEKLLTRILEKDTFIKAVYNLDYKDEWLLPFIDFNDINLNEPIHLERTKIISTKFTCEQFYIEDNVYDWDLINFLKFCKNENGKEFFIGIETTVGKKHSASVRGEQLINDLLNNSDEVDDYYHVFFVPNKEYFTPPANLNISSAKIFVCEVKIEKVFGM
jgi:hypothetical protein